MMIMWCCGKVCCFTCFVLVAFTSLYFRVCNVLGISFGVCYAELLYLGLVSLYGLVWEFFGFACLDGSIGSC